MQFGKPKLGDQATKIKSCLIREYLVAMWQGGEALEVTNTYTEKGMICLNKNLAEWIYCACEENLRLDLMGAQA